MKKCAMLLVALLVFVVMMCAPSYGDILVYKITDQFNPSIGFADDSYTTATVGVTKITGYGVSDIDMETGGLNGTPTLIFYDSKAKWYYSVDANENLTGFLGFSIEGTAGRGVFCYITLDVNAGTWFSYLYGKSAMVDIGRTDKRKVQIPKSLKGITNISTSGSAPTNAFGNGMMTLDAKYTQNANRIGATQANTVDRIIADLEMKGYIPG